MRRYQSTVLYGQPTRSTFVLLNFLVLALFLWTSVGLGDDQPEMRTWTSTAGSPARAALLGVEGQQARLKFADGSEKSVPIDQLSAEDQEYIGQWLDRRANKPEQTWKRFRHRSTGQQLDGLILERVNVRGQRKLFVKYKSGFTEWLWEAMFEITDVTDTPPVAPPVAQPDRPSTNPSGGSEIVIKPTTPRPTVQNVIVTGAGATLDEARKNAFSAAIERVVGVLVDAETLVTNDEIVRDQVLTFSRGYINGHQEISNREEGELHYVTIRANVSVTKLGEKLKQVPNIAFTEIDGSVIKSLIEIDRENEQIAREMFRKATIDFTPKQLISVTTLDTKRKDTGAKVELTVAYRLDADPDAWKSIHTNLKPLLDTIATKHSVYTSRKVRQPGFGYRIDWESSQPFQPEEKTASLSLFKGSTPEGTTVYWDTYLVPVSFAHEMASLAERVTAYRVRVSLVDTEDRIIASMERNLSGYLVLGRSRAYRGNTGFESSSIGPLLYYDKEFRSSRAATATFSIDVEELGRVAKCVATIELASDEP